MRALATRTAIAWLWPHRDDPETRQRIRNLVASTRSLDRIGRAFAGIAAAREHVSKEHPE